jgi:bud site selection protein 31
VTSFPPPDDTWTTLTNELDYFEEARRDAIEHDHGTTSLWPLHQVHYDQNRAIYRKRFIEHKLSRATYSYFVRYRIADGDLIAKWRRRGYRALCSLWAISRCTAARGHAICRVPLRKRRSIGDVEAGKSAFLQPSRVTGCVTCTDDDCVEPRTQKVLDPIWFNTEQPDWAEIPPVQRSAVARRLPRRRRGHHETGPQRTV